MMEKEILARRQRMQELNCQAQDLVDAGHFDPNAVEETRIVMEERFVGSFFFKDDVVVLNLFFWDKWFVCLFVCLCPLGTRGILLALKEVALNGKTI